MNTVKIRNIEVGEGMPKIIVPIVGRSREEIVSRGKELSGMDLDMVEWRADFYDDVFDTGKVLETLKELREALGEKALLFTFRTKKEGGEKAMDADAYTEMNAAVAGSGNADALDVEIFSGDDVVRRNIEAIHTAGKVVIGSNHDFFRTPSKADLIYRLRKMQDMEADIPKIAVMPQNKDDVLTLLAATEEMKRYADRPIITMSMSATGVISRLCGEVFGSSMTFGTVGAASAPGQIPVGQLRESMEILHSAL
ncbi:type I 3-dehydroquinate dehydratase [[Clostridium] aminophilum]|uniref:3-dehydroquinate dehydratase n=1 Tax=[Clostridium] aminophilum TaxID=1526 RepID=A0A1I6IAC0_9FIRM|nr:type I 3-dehydroquinate dehydratase [[Clostridium] aminophilum]SFR63633.1 3-dehydroquinate dehydratase [[Clostridium] aminophilum]